MLFNIILYSSVGVLSSLCSTVRCILFSHIFNSFLIIFMCLILFRATVTAFSFASKYFHNATMFFADVNVLSSGKSSFSVSLRIIFFVKKLYIG